VSATLVRQSTTVVIPVDIARWADSARSSVESVRWSVDRASDVGYA
jgi:hypothetical protein